jgi:hypothetical protein
MRESVLMRLLLCGSELLMRLRAGIGSISLGSSTGLGFKLEADLQRGLAG